MRKFTITTLMIIGLLAIMVVSTGAASADHGGKRFQLGLNENLTIVTQEAYTNCEVKNNGDIKKSKKAAIVIAAAQDCSVDQNVEVKTEQEVEQKRGKKGGAQVGVNSSVTDIYQYAETNCSVVNNGDIKKSKKAAIVIIAEQDCSVDQNVEVKTEQEVEQK